MTQCEFCGANLTGSGNCPYCGGTNHKQMHQDNRPPRHMQNGAPRHIPHGTPRHIQNGAPPHMMHGTPRSRYSHPDTPKHEIEPRVMSSKDIPMHGYMQGTKNDRRVHINAAFGAGPLQTTLAILCPKLYIRFAEKFDWGIYRYTVKRYSIASLIALLVVILVVIVLAVLLIIWLIKR